MSKAMTVVKNELRELLPAMLFFLVAFHMMSITKAVILTDYHITTTSSTVATVSALIVAKTILLLDHTALARLFSNRLLYNLLWKTLLFGTVAVCLRQVEELIPVMIKHGDIGAAIRAVISNIPTARFAIIHMWLYVMLLIYSSASEAVRMLGRPGAWAILWGPISSHQSQGAD